MHTIHTPHTPHAPHTLHALPAAGGQDALAEALAAHPPHAPALERLRVGALSRAGLIDALCASEHLLAHVQALQARILAALDAARTADRLDCTVEEVAAATRWAPNTAQRRLYEAGVLATVFPETLALLHTGQATWPQAAALIDLTSHLQPDAARTVQARVLPRLARQSVAATRKALHRAVLAADPQGAHRRHEQQARERRVALYPEPDGMTTLTLYTPAQTGTAVMAALDQHARPRQNGDERTLDQRRADTLAALVLGAAGVPLGGTQDPATRIPALVHVTVGIDTLLGADQEPADLTGYGPITAAQARALAFGANATWRRLLTAPDGALLHTDPTTYRPTASVERLVRARDRHCAFPGCAMPAQRCDLDHITAFNHDNPASGGATMPDNLQALCRRHHQLKTAGTWQAARDRDGHTTWNAPTGHTYTTAAPVYAAAA